MALILTVVAPITLFFRKHYVASERSSMTSSRLSCMRQVNRRLWGGNFRKIKTFSVPSFLFEHGQHQRSQFGFSLLVISDNLSKLSFKFFLKFLLMLLEVESFELVCVEPLEVSLFNILKI